MITLKRRQISLQLGIALCVLMASSLAGLAQSANDAYFQSSDALNRFVSDLVTRTVTAHPITREQLAITLVDLNGDTPVAAHHRGDVRVYPASVVKAFYEAMAYHLIEDKGLVQTAELTRGLVDMIRDSNNDATAYILDVDTDTTAGPELSPEELADFAARRQTVNQYFQSLGYRNINTVQKAYSFGPYGRERQYLRMVGSNALTTEMTARLMYEISTGQLVSPEASSKMLGLLKRDLTAPRSSNPDDQTFGFIGNPLPSGSLLWSKAGWTSTVRHDAAKVILPGGQAYILVIFTSGQAFRRPIIHDISRWVAEYMQGRNAKTNPIASTPTKPSVAPINANNTAGWTLGGPAEFWSPETTCNGHAFRTTTPTSFPGDGLNYATIPVPPAVEGRRVRVFVWVPTCYGDAKANYYIRTRGAEYGPYELNQAPYDDVFVPLNSTPVQLNADSYLYLSDYSRWSGVIALSDVRFDVVSAGAEEQSPEIPEASESSKKSIAVARNGDPE